MVGPGGICTLGSYCEECPFGRWDKAFNIQGDWGFGCFSFGTWLKQYATL